MRFEDYKLGEISTFKYGKMPKKDRIKVKGYPIYTGYKVSGYYDEYMYEAEQLIVVARGVGGTGDVKLAPEKSYITNLSIIVELDKKKADKTYMMYYLNSLKLRYLDTGSAQSQITIKDLTNLKVRIPCLKEQKKVAQTLNKLFEKIELNNSIIANLEELAQTLFKHWFVDFEFPNEEGKPYKSSGGKMVESELGMIPEGWEVKSLSEIANFQNGLAMQKFRPGEGEDSLPVLKIKELRQGFTDYNSDLCSTNIKDSVKVYDGDVIFSWSATLLVKLWVGGNAGLNQHLFKVTSEEHSKWFYYLWTKHYLDLFNAIAQDKATTMGHIKRSHLDESKVIVPSEQHYIYFDSVFNRIIEQKINLLKENKSLIGLRDTLLPKLLSGEIELPDDMEVTEDVPIS